MHFKGRASINDPIPTKHRAFKQNRIQDAYFISLSHSFWKQWHFIFQQTPFFKIQNVIF